MTQTTPTTPVFDGTSVRVFIPELAKKLGLNPAIVLCQMHYWLQNPNWGCYPQKDSENNKWIFNDYEDWLKQFPWLGSVSTIGRHIRYLERLGLIKSGNFNNTPYDQRKWYRLDYYEIARQTGWNPLNLTIVQNCPLEKSSFEIPTSTDEHSSISKEEPNLNSQQNSPVVALSQKEALGTQPEDPQLPPNPKESLPDDNDSVSQGNPEAALIFEAVAGAGIQMNSTLRALVVKYTLFEVISALACYTKALEQGKVLYPPGWFTECLRNGWWKTDRGTASNVASIAADTDWTEHPDWEAWLSFMRSRGVPTFVAYGEDWFDNKTRRAIADWAEEKNLIWVGEYAY